MSNQSPIDKAISKYGSRVYLHAVGVDTTEFDAVQELKDKLYQLLLDELSVNQKGQFEDDAGHICWYLDDLQEALKQLMGVE